ncbi:MAG: glycosyltransferase [Bacteroidales bacterium]|nr:glycosyltransferase [Bacteroidales bacterium]
MFKARSPRILVCPLDWGLGHATRCIPLIRELDSAGATVVLAAAGPQLNLLRTEFPEMEWINFPGYKIKYGNKTGAGYKVFFGAPRLALRILREHYQLRNIIFKYRIDGIISDNRYGLWNRKVYSVFMTHQLNIIAPEFLKFAEPILHAGVKYFAEKYDECWIPDEDGDNNLSGILSHGKGIPKNAVYIGLLSRFDRKEFIRAEKQYDLVAIVSGPEPQRAVFENKLLGQLPVEGKKCLIIRGIPGEMRITNLRSNLDVADHLSAGQMQGILTHKPVVVSRPGYSTLMDIACTGNRAILIPTPGQTEQEYLARSLVEKGYHVSCNQNEMNIGKALFQIELIKQSLSYMAKPKYTGAIGNVLRKLKESLS